MKDAPNGYVFIGPLPEDLPKEVVLVNVLYGQVDLSTWWDELGYEYDAEGPTGDRCAAIATASLCARQRYGLFDDAVLPAILGWVCVRDHNVESP